ncbi:hypothetical protein F4U02_13245 [Acinetobacter haemolyticus]|uniref:hypothetical protein n=1 Tax=Acinetobacter haemolyticus TaxID=29430 RepID=UPI0012985C38|nr:hypothetical protein [Acinetobacter haemolyticus]MQZ31950.1 hypothetical protein [Acinetobacter haemolyticus]
MDNTEQTIETTEQTSTPGEVEQQVEQQQGGEGGSEVELTEEQQAEAAAKQAEEEKAAQRQAAIDKRFAKLTWEKNEALRKAQELEQKYAKQEQSSKAEPQLHEFDSIEDYAKALSKYKEDKVKQDYQSQFEQQRVEQLRQAQALKLDAAEAEFQKGHADYQQVVGNLVNLSGGQLPNEIGNAVLELGDDAPAVLYEIGKDPVEFVELLGMSPTLQLMKLGEVRATLKNSPKTPKIPNTPAPVNPPKGGANSKKDPHAGSDADFLRSRGLT